jgi:hypothetical protein
MIIIYDTVSQRLTARLQQPSPSSPPFPDQFSNFFDVFVPRDQKVTKTGSLVSRVTVRVHDYVCRRTADQTQNQSVCRLSPHRAGDA